MARPRKRLHERLDTRLDVRMTTEQRARYERTAAAFGMSASEWLRRVGDGEPPPPALADRQQTAVVATALIRLGNNLNQIARHMNAGRAAPPDLGPLLARINAELDRLYGPENGEGRPVL